MAAPTWRATTRLIAAALTSSYEPSSRNQLSNVEPMFFFFMLSLSPFSSERQINILLRRFLGLFHEPMQQDQTVLADDPAVRRVQALQPFPYRLAPRIRAIKARRQ